MEHLATKFYMPRLRPGVVARPRLLQRLDEGVHFSRPLTLVSAPAGYGKTTLVAAWLQQNGHWEPPVPPYIREREDLILARFFQVTGWPKPALDIVRPILVAARADGLAPSSRL